MTRWLEIVLKSDVAPGDLNKIPQYRSIQNVYLQNEDYYFFVMGFISNTRLQLKFSYPVIYYRLL